MLRKADCADKRNLKIYQEELKDFLPDKILDFHVHLIPADAVPADYIREFPYPETPGANPYPLEEFKSDMEKYLPGKEVSAVCFGMPRLEFDSARENDYIAENCDRRRFFPLMLIRPTDDITRVRKEMENKGFLGYKPYPLYVDKEPDDIEIADMLTPAQWELAEETGMIILLHIPRKERLADPLNLKQIKSFARQYPNVKIIVAHIGRAYYFKNIAGNIEQIAGLKNVYADIAMLNNIDVLDYLLRNFDRRRIIYGSDTPVGIMPGKSVEINDQYTYITPHKWQLSIQDTEGRVHYTSFMYEEIRAVRKAAERAGLSRKEVEGIFYSNGRNLLKNVIRKEREDG